MPTTSCHPAVTRTDTVIQEAHSLLHKQEYRAGLQLLQPYLKSEVLHPLARALASQCYAHLGHRAAAFGCLRQAVIQFDWCDASSQATKQDIAAKPELLVIIKQAAGLLKEHRLLVELQHRWSAYPATEKDRFLTGTAYFNVGEAKEALSCWKPLAAKEEWGFLTAYIAVAALQAEGYVPLFPLEYDVPAAYRPADIQVWADNMHTGWAKALVLGWLLEGQFNGEENSFIQLLLERTGDWGLQLALQLLDAPGVSKEIKLAALFALVELGVYDPEEEIPLILDGQEHLVRVNRQEQTVASPQEEEQLLQAVKALIQAGSLEKAAAYLESYTEHCFSAVGLQLLGQIYLKLGERQKCCAIADIFAAVHPPADNHILIAAELLAEAGDSYASARCLARVCHGELAPALQRKFRRLREWTYPFIPLPKRRGLATCLHRLPASWLSCICRKVKCSSSGRRREREKQVAAVVQSSLLAIVRRLSPQARTLLAWLEGRGGSLPLDELPEAYYGSRRSLKKTPLMEILIHGLAFMGPLDEDPETHCLILPAEIQRGLAELE